VNGEDYMNNRQRFIDIMKKTEDKKNKAGRAFIAFISGGVIALIGQAFFDFYNKILKLEESEAVSIMLVTIILISAILTGVGGFDKIAQKCGAGTFVPISGFSNALTSSALECRSEGLIFGIGSNMFKLAGSVIIFGVVSAYLFGLLRLVIMGG
jgi:stage V sporulation protein AC